MSNTFPPSVVPTLDTGLLSSVAVGDEVALVWEEYDSGAVRYVVRGVQPVVAVTEDRILCGKARSSFDRGTGKTRVHLYGEMFYISANPEFIAIAKARALAEADIAQAARDERQTRLDVALPIALDLLDESGDPATPADLADALTNRLTTEQLNTLRGWLAAR